MEPVTRSVRDIDTVDRQAIEHVLGTHLSENQQVVIQVLNADIANVEETESKPRKSRSPELPQWCNVYEGLSDAEISDIESSFVRSRDSRSFR